MTPKLKTLRRYGMTPEDWETMLWTQGGKCPLCHRGPPDVRMVTDHEHARGFRKMTAIQRRRHVRGICCLRCNMRFLRAGLTAEIAQNVADYLRRYATAR